MPDLSVIIPARNERWLARTVRDVLDHSSDATEVIVILDGGWPPEEPLPQHPRLQVVFLPESIGQRAATNLGARISQAEYVMKVDGHVSMAPGFDQVLIAAAKELGPRVTQIPAQKNLHIWDRVCRTCGKRNYQGPMDTPCVCGGACDIDIVWQPRGGTTTTCWYFDSEPHFQYAPREMRRRQQWDGDIADVMTSLGACFFMRRDFFWEIGGLDEQHGSWGNYGIEVACRTWLSGGRHVVNRGTWFAHLFRVGGIGFPYPIHGSDQQKARQYSRDYWFNNRMPGQVRPLRWLVDKFWDGLKTAKVKDATGAMVPAWTEEQRQALPSTLPVAMHGVRTVTVGTPSAILNRPERVQPLRAPRGVVYYSDCRPDPRILEASRQSIEASGMPIVAVTLQLIRWPSARTIVLDAERSVLTMFRQILAGLEALDTDVAFLCEHDVIYAPDHFRFTPARADRYYYQMNVWKVDANTGRAVHYRTKQTSGLCADRQLLIEHYRKRMARVEREGFTRKMGFEPGSHRRPERVDDIPSEEWWSPVPNVDIRHTTNLTPSRWSRDEFRDQKNCQGWTEADAVPGWPGQTQGRFWEWLADLSPVEVLA